jgi:mRNA interferase MazF
MTAATLCCRAFRSPTGKPSKKRPAVIIHSPAYQDRPDLIVMAITSRVRQPLATGEALLQDWQAAGLAKPSVFKPLIATLEKTQIVKT